MHVLKTEPVIGQLRVPIGLFGLFVHLRRVIVLRGDSPASGNIPADQVGRGMWSLGLSTAHASRGPCVYPPAILPLLWIDSRWSRWYEGVVVGGRRWSGILGCRNDGGRGPG